MAMKITDDGVEPANTLPPPIGDNSAAARVPELLAEKYPELAREARELLDKTALYTFPIQTEKAQKEWGDHFVAMKGFLDKLTATFKHEKAPWLIGGREVDNFFKVIGEPVRTFADQIEVETANYLQWKKNEEEKRLRAEKQRVEEEARKAREAADKAKREADEAARKAAAKIAEAKNVSLRAARTMLPAAVVKKQDKATDAALTAQQAERRVDHVDDKIAGKAADKVRTRGGSSVSTLAEEWTHAIDDITKIPIEVIRPYLHPDAIDAACKGAVKAGIRKIPGVRIFKAPKAQIRR